MRRKKQNDSDDLALGAPRQVRFQRGVERDLVKIAELNGMDFPSALRMATRLGLQKLREGCLTGKKQSA